MGLIMVRVDLLMFSRDANTSCESIRNEGFTVASNDGMPIYSISAYLYWALMK